MAKTTASKPQITGVWDGNVLTLSVLNDRACIKFTVSYVGLKAPEIDWNILGADVRAEPVSHPAKKVLHSARGKPRTDSMSWKNAGVATFKLIDELHRLIFVIDYSSPKIDVTVSTRDLKAESSSVAVPAAEDLDLPLKLVD